MESSNNQQDPGTPVSQPSTPTSTWNQETPQQTVPTGPATSNAPGPPNQTVPSIQGSSTSSSRPSNSQQPPRRILLTDDEIREFEQSLQNQAGPLPSSSNTTTPRRSFQGQLTPTPSTSSGALSLVLPANISVTIGGNPGINPEQQRTLNTDGSARRDSNAEQQVPHNPEIAQIIPVKTASKNRSRKSNNVNPSDSNTAQQESQPSTSTVELLEDEDEPPSKWHGFDQSLVGKQVPPHTRMAGAYRMGPKIGQSPVRSIVHHLGILGHDDYYLLKMLTLLEDGKNADHNNRQDELHGKMLIHNEHSILSILGNFPGVVRKHNFFVESVPQEQILKKDKLVYTGRWCKRVTLVLDCLVSNDYNPRSHVLTNLQMHIIKERKLDEKEAMDIFLRIVDIVERLHEVKVVHRDLKLGNVVLNRKTGNVVLNNFCLAKHLMTKDDMLTDWRGSPAYVAPEVLGNRPYKGQPSDIWSLGVILYTMVYGQFPFYDAQPQELFWKIKKGEYAFPDYARVSEQTREIIRRTFVLDPASRIDAAQLRELAIGAILSWKSGNLALKSKAAKELRTVPDIDDPEDGKKKEKDEKRENNSRYGDPMLLNVIGASDADMCRVPLTDEQKEEIEMDRDAAKYVQPNRMKVTTVESDAQPLTTEQFHEHATLVARLRQRSTNVASSTGLSFLGTANQLQHGDTFDDSPEPFGGTTVNDSFMSGAADDSEILVNVNSSIMEDFVERARLMEESDMISGFPRRMAPSMFEASSVSAAVPVPDEDNSLDLSSMDQRLLRVPTVPSANLRQ